MEKSLSLEPFPFIFVLDKKSIPVMNQFIKNTLASALGTFLTIVVLTILGGIALFGLFMTIAGSFDRFTSEKKEEIQDGSVLKVELDEPIMDRAGQKRFKFEGPGDLSMFKEAGLNEILEALEKARHDERIEGIQLKIDKVVAGMATMKELREGIETFRDSSDKFIWAFDQGYSQRSYYLTSTADSLFLYPEGGMSFKGLVSEVTFFKGLLDKFDIEMQVVRGSNNKYKSAVEPFTRKKMSEASRKQVRAYLNDLWSVVLEDIEKARDISQGTLNRIADSLLIRSPKDAVEHGLVDKLAYHDEFKKKLREKLDRKEDEEIPYVSLEDYMGEEVPDEHWAGPERDQKEDKKEEEKIAVVYAMGAIQSGENEKGVLGAKSTSKAIRKAREDSTVKAVVMRVNSPGGSALASDRIWREVKLTEKKKPFIVSMGDLAASGGYYISCGADRIFADPNTITGSIGVFGMIPHTGDLFKKHLGITFDRIKTNEYADMGNPNRPLRKQERELIEEQIDSVYQQFLQRVADGRDMEKKMVDSLARGRVWSGKDAERIGLVDEMGGLEDAIAHASDKAGLEDPERIAYPERESPFKEFLESFKSSSSSKLLEGTIGRDLRFYRKYRYLRSVLDMKGIQMRMPYHIEVR